MFCNNCGQETDNNIAFCPHCGAKLASVENEPLDNTSNSKNTYATIGFILGIVSWILSFFGIVGILAIVFSSLGLSNLPKCNNKGKAFSIIGLIMGICSVVYAVITFIWRMLLKGAVIKKRLPFFMTNKIL